MPALSGNSDAAGGAHPTFMGHALPSLPGYGIGMSSMPASEESSHDLAPRDTDRPPVIEANGAEYLVTINGSVFLALSLAQAETIAYRSRRRPQRD
jgi:hypothetical protein